MEARGSVLICFATSEQNGWLVCSCCHYWCLLLATEFITNSIINAIGLTTQNFLQMSLFTDPLGDGSFTRNWTVFYWLWWILIHPGVAMFVTWVSRGRKIKEVSILGTDPRQHRRSPVFFGVMESYAIHQFINWRNQRPTGAGNTAATELHSKF
ncbi:BCCT family transporter [Shigella sonnei]